MTGDCGMADDFRDGCAPMSCARVRVMGVCRDRVFGRVVCVPQQNSAGASFVPLTTSRRRLTRLAHLSPLHRLSQRRPACSQQWLHEFIPTLPYQLRLCTPHTLSRNPSRMFSQAYKTRTGATTKRCVSVDHGVCMRQILMVLDNCRKTRSALSVSRRWTYPISISSRALAVTR